MMIEVIIFLLIVIVFGVLPMMIYSKQENNTTEHSKPNIIFAIITIMIVLLNTFLSFSITGASIAYIFGKVYFLPLAFIVIFSLSKKYRNWKSRFNVLFYTSLIVLIGLVGSIFNRAS
jgi:hypothetical protein